ncbi:hypothetical protein BH23ACI1_BH23ACI1_29820 [soil metagenome]|nr:hypothetical protein [Acidobacteriota bacterium]
MQCRDGTPAIAKTQRSGRVLQRLLAGFWRYSLKEGFDAAVISGTTSQLKMYRRLGFEPFGLLVGTPEAQFQPMYVTRDRAPDASRSFPATPRAEASPTR